MSILSLLSSGLIGYAVYQKLSYNRAEMRRKEILEGREKLTWKQRAVRLGNLVANKKLKSRLETIGLTTDKYVLETLGFMVLTPLLVYAAFTNLFMTILAVPAGYGVAYLRYYTVYTTWRRDIQIYVPELVTYLKIRLKVGDTVSLAIQNILPLLKGGMAGEWARVVAMINSGTPLETALNSFIERIQDRDLTAVLVRLISYAKEGVPDDPFGDLTEHMAHLAALQKKYQLKRVTAPITIYAGLSMLVAIITGLVPYFYSIIRDLLGQLPAGFF